MCKRQARRTRHTMPSKNFAQSPKRRQFCEWTNVVWAKKLGPVGLFVDTGLWYRRGTFEKSGRASPSELLKSHYLTEAKVSHCSFWHRSAVKGGIQSPTTSYSSLAIDYGENFLHVLYQHINFIVRGFWGSALLAF